MNIDTDTDEGKKALAKLIKEGAEDAISEATAALAAKNKELLGELKKAKKGSEIDPAEVAALEEQIDKLKNDLNTATKEAKKTKDNLDQVTKQLQEETGFTQKLLVDNGLTETLVKAGVAAEYLPAVKALHASKVSVVADGEKRVAKVGDKDLSAHITEWSQSDEGKHFIRAPNNQGGGAPGPGNRASGLNTIKRADFAALPPAGQMAHIKGGGAVID